MIKPFLPGKKLISKSWSFFQKGNAFCMRRRRFSLKGCLSVTREMKGWEIEEIEEEMWTVDNYGYSK